MIFSFLVNNEVNKSITKYISQSVLNPPFFYYKNFNHFKLNNKQNESIVIYNNFLILFEVLAIYY